MRSALSVRRSVLVRPRWSAVCGPLRNGPLARALRRFTLSVLDRTRPVRPGAGGRTSTAWSACQVPSPGLPGSMMVIGTMSIGCRFRGGVDRIGVCAPGRGRESRDSFLSMSARLTASRMAAVDQVGGAARGRGCRRPRSFFLLGWGGTWSWGAGGYRFCVPVLRSQWGSGDE